MRMNQAADDPKRSRPEDEVNAVLASAAIRGLLDALDGRLLSEQELDRALGLGTALIAPVQAPDVPGEQERWLAENRDALKDSNEFVARHGLPLARHRNF